MTRWTVKYQGGLISLTGGYEHGQSERLCYQGESIHWSRDDPLLLNPTQHPINLARAFAIAILFLSSSGATIADICQINKLQCVGEQQNFSNLSMEVNSRRNQLPFRSDVFWDVQIKLHI